MKSVGLYLSGCGSLDGSDVMATVLAYHSLQDADCDPVPVARDLSQGDVINHRTARPEDRERNALDEAARIVRGNITEMREVEVGELDGALFVGGGGTLSTWTDFKERGKDCRVTERLKFHVLDLYRNGKPLLGLDNAGFVLGIVLKETVDSLRINPGNNRLLREIMREWELEVTNESPTWDSNHRIGSIPNLSREEDLPELRNSIDRFIRGSEFT